MIAWNIFSAFIAFMLLMALSIFMVSPLMFFIGDTVSNASQNATGSVWVNPMPRAAADNLWVPASTGFAVLGFVCVLAYGLDKMREEDEEREESERNDVPQFEN
jgi:hypothetical protein